MSYEINLIRLLFKVSVRSTGCNCERCADTLLAPPRGLCDLILRLELAHVIPPGRLIWDQDQRGSSSEGTRGDTSDIIWQSELNIYTFTTMSARNAASMRMKYRHGPHMLVCSVVLNSPCFPVSATKAEFEPTKTALVPRPQPNLWNGTVSSHQNHPRRSSDSLPFRRLLSFSPLPAPPS